MKRIAASLFLFAACSALAAPTRIDAEYQVSKGGLVIGRMVESYERNADTYVIRSTTSSEGALKLFLDDSIILSSEGRVGPHGLEPAVFEQKRAGNASRDIHATFDWTAGVMRSQFRGESKDVELPPGTQDRISIMYQFMNVSPKGDTFEFPMANGRKVERYTYRRTGEATLKTPAGDFETIHYERVVREGESKAEVWLAKDRFNFPVRVVFDDPKGLRLEQSLMALKVR